MVVLSAVSRQPRPPSVQGTFQMQASQHRHQQGWTLVYDANASAPTNNIHYTSNIYWFIINISILFLHFIWRRRHFTVSQVTTAPSVDGDVLPLSDYTHTWELTSTDCSSVNSMGDSNSPSLPQFSSVTKFMFHTVLYHRVIKIIRVSWHVVAM